jgi:hypothetical protein
MPRNRLISPKYSYFYIFIAVICIASTFLSGRLYADGTADTPVTKPKAHDRIHYLTDKISIGGSFKQTPMPERLMISTFVLLSMSALSSDWIRR